MEDEFLFGEFRLQPGRRMLYRGGEEVPLTARAFAVLQALVERGGQLVSKDELMRRVWAGVVVEDNNLAVQVGVLRKLLGADAIATLAGRGYRFALPLAGAAAVAGKTNLATPGSPLLGRDDDVEALCQWLRAQRLVTLVGAGGIGKSRLAQAVGHSLVPRWRDGAWWLELAGLVDPGLLPASLARVLGLGASVSAGSPATLAAALREREMLLVIDNCEHLLDAVAELVEPLLDAVPGLQVLATSQEPLRLRREQQYRLNPLAVPHDAATPEARSFGALALLISRVRSATPSWSLGDADLPLAIELCRRLDGLPLAIELAAARVPLLGLRTVHDGLDERFRLLTCGTRQGLPRHQSLRAAMVWSHGLLSDAQRTVFMRLGTFSGGFTLGLAQSMCRDDRLDAWAVLDELAALVQKSLVVMDDGPSPRYRLLESARAFALEQWVASGEMARGLGHHARAMLEFLRRIDDANIDGVLRTHEYAAQVLPELDNLRAAYAWADGPGGDRTTAIALAAHVGPLIDYSQEFVAWLLRQRAYLDHHALDDATAARLWRGLAAFNLSGHLAMADQAHAAQRAAALYRRLGSPRRMFSALRFTAVWALGLNDCTGAGAALDEAESVLQPDWGPEFRISLLRTRGVLARQTGQLGAARAFWTEGLRLAREVAGDWRLEVMEQIKLADLSWQAGHLEEADAAMADLIERLVLRPASDVELIDALDLRIAILCERGRIDAAAALAREALPVMRRMPRFSLVGCAHLLFRLGRPEEAARVIGLHAARVRAGMEPMAQPNKDRLLALTQAGIAAALVPARVAALLGTDDPSLGHAGACTLLAEALSEQPTPASRRMS
jgi:predicted ATPase/DNA-binding winged helix-turn-helix (wHTH) protein